MNFEEIIVMVFGIVRCQMGSGAYFLLRLNDETIPLVCHVLPIFGCLSCTINSLFLSESVASSFVLRTLKLLMLLRLCPRVVTNLEY